MCMIARSILLNFDLNVQIGEPSDVHSAIQKGAASSNLACTSSCDGLKEFQPQPHKPCCQGMQGISSILG